MISISLRSHRGYLFAGLFVAMVAIVIARAAFFATPAMDSLTAHKSIHQVFQQPAEISIVSHTAVPVLGMRLADIQDVLGSGTPGGVPSLTIFHQPAIAIWVYTQMGTDGTERAKNISVVGHVVNTFCNQFFPAGFKWIGQVYGGPTTYYSSDLASAFNNWPLGRGMFVTQSSKAGCTVNTGGNG